MMQAMIVAIDSEHWAFGESSSEAGIRHRGLARVFFHLPFFFDFRKPPVQEIADGQYHGEKAEQYCGNSEVRYPIHSKSSALSDRSIGELPRNVQ